MQDDFAIRAATPSDVSQIHAIYAHHVANGTGTFEETAPDLIGIVQRMAEVIARDLPYLVAERDGALLGFAYASPFRLRSAYRYCAEDSVYVAPDMTGQGIGTALLNAVVAACETKGLRQIIALIGDSTNAGSVGVHRTCGFSMIGVAQGVGFKHGRFLDVVFMQKALNGGDVSEPDWPGLSL